MQATGQPGRLLIRYGEPDAPFESTRADGAPGTPGNLSSAGQDAPQSGGPLKDQILGSVRQQAGREISSGVGRIARKAIRKLLGGR